MLSRVPEGKNQLGAFFEQPRQLDICGANGPMEIDRSKQLGSNGQKLGQGRKPVRMNRQSPRGKKGVAQKPIPVKRPRRQTGQPSVPQDKVHIVNRVQTGKKGPKQVQPAGMLGVFLLLRPDDQKRDLLGIDRLVVTKNPIGGTAQTANGRCQTLFNDHRPKPFMRQLFTVRILETR